MPYKTAVISGIGITYVIVGMGIGGFISGFWLIRPSKGSDVIPLQPVAAFFSISGFIGTVINFSFDISGTPALAILALSAGIGMITFLLVSLYRHAS